MQLAERFFISPARMELRMDPGRRFNVLSAIFIFFIFLLTLYVTRDFLFPVLFSVVLVFLLRPLYDLFLRATHNRILSSAFSIVVVLIVMLLVLIGLTQVLLTELSNLQTRGFQISSAQNATQNIELWLNANFSDPILTFLLELVATFNQTISGIIGALKSILIFMATGLPLYFAQSIIVLFFTFFLLFEGESFVDKAVKLVPLDQRERVNYFLQELSYIYDNIFSAYVLTALVTGLLSVFVFFLLNIPYPFVLGLVVAIFTLIPLIGALWVFIPLSALFLLQGNLNLAAALAISGILMFVVPQYLILPRLARRGAQIHPLITVLAFVGALFALGLPGIIIGPMLYGFLLAVYRTVDHYGEEASSPLNMDPAKTKASEGQNSLEK
jgi:predicted PurR-regulated permease PerM